MYIHELNKDVNLDLLVNTLLKLIKKELIESIGFSNIHLNEVKTLVELIGPKVKNLRSIQNEFHLLKTNDLNEFIPFLSKHSISYSAYLT